MGSILTSNVKLEMSTKHIFLLVYFTTVNSETDLKSVTVSVKTDYKFTFNYNIPHTPKTQDISNAINNVILKEDPINYDYIQEYIQEIIHNKSEEPTGVIPNLTELFLENNKQFETDNNYIDSKSETIHGGFANADESSGVIEEKFQNPVLELSSEPKTDDRKGDTEDNNPEKKSRYRFFNFTDSSEKKENNGMPLEHTRRSTHTPVSLKKEQTGTSASISFEKISNEERSSRFSDKRMIAQKKKNPSRYYVFFQNSDEGSGEENPMTQSVTQSEKAGKYDETAVETSAISLINGYEEVNNIRGIGLGALNLSKKLNETRTNYNYLETKKRDVKNANTMNTRENISKYTFFEKSKEDLDSNVDSNSFISKPLTSTEYLLTTSTYSHIDLELNRMNANVNSDSSANVDLRRYNKSPGAKTVYDTMAERISNDFHATAKPTYDPKKGTASEYPFSVGNHDNNYKKINDDGVTKRYTFFDDSDLYDEESSENKFAITQLQTPKYESFENITKEYVSKSEGNEKPETKLLEKTVGNNIDRKENSFQFRTTQLGQTEGTLSMEETTTEIAETSSTSNDLFPQANEDNIGTLKTRRDANNSISLVHEDGQLDKILLQEVKKIVAKVNPAYFMVVADQLSIQSTTHLGKQTSTFAISPVCLTALLLTLTLGMKGQSRTQIDEGLKYYRSNKERIRAVELLLGLIPSTTTKLSSWSTTRLFVPQKLVARAHFKSQAQRALNMNVESVDTVDASAALQYVNKAIETDTKGRMPNAFDDEDFQDSLGSEGLLLANCLYWRGDWQGSVTVLNGTRIFYTGEGNQDLAMYRLNDIMKYADVPDWNAQVVEIPYAAKDAWLVLLIPREVDGLFNLEDLFLNDGNEMDILAYLDPLLTIKRVQITLPKYTLESRIMLPSKLKELGLDGMLSNSADLDGIVDGVTRLGSAVQRTKLWADDGRGSFKDDGLQWDPLPDVEVFADRPYIFMLKVKDVVLISGHFYGSGR